MTSLPGQDYLPFVHILFIYCNTIGIDCFMNFPKPHRSNLINVKFLWLLWLVKCLIHTISKVHISCYWHCCLSRTPYAVKVGRCKTPVCLFWEKILTFDLFLEVYLYQSQHANTSYCNTSIISVCSWHCYLSRVAI